MNASHFNASHE